MKVGSELVPAQGKAINTISDLARHKVSSLLSARLAVGQGLGGQQLLAVALRAIRSTQDIDGLLMIID
jgi:hypothetical protein